MLLTSVILAEVAFKVKPNRGAIAAVLMELSVVKSRMESSLIVRLIAVWVILVADCKLLTATS